MGMYKGIHAYMCMGYMYICIYVYVEIGRCAWAYVCIYVL